MKTQADIEQFRDLINNVVIKLREAPVSCENIIKIYEDRISVLNWVLDIKPKDSENEKTTN